MSDLGPALTDDQWNRIREIVHDQAMRARVAASFLPLYGPLPGDTTTVPGDLLTQPRAGDQGSLEVNDYATIRLASVAVNVAVKNHMLADPELGAASILFRRAANIIARVEDAIIFRGKNANNVPGTETLPQVFTLSGSDYVGLFDLAPSGIHLPTGSTGPAIFSAVVAAINALENAAYYKPFACVLSDNLFQRIYEPIPNSMVLPADSIPPMLNGPLLRSSTLEDDTGLVVSLQGNPVEIVVGQEIHVRYLQGTPEGDNLFRVSQRFVLRVKDPTAIVTIASHPAVAPGATRPRPTRKG
jgi:uncharacterized linocin/CFP29 family protein